MNNFKIIDLNETNDVHEVLCEIDKRLAKLSKNKLDSIRYHIKHDKNSKLKPSLFFILEKYKNILERIIKCDSCFSEYKLEHILSNIKQYLSLGKLNKVIPEKEIKKIKAQRTTDQENVSINYNFDTVNILNKNYRTTINEETWDQVEW